MVTRGGDSSTRPPMALASSCRDSVEIIGDAMEAPASKIDFFGRGHPHRLDVGSLSCASLCSVLLGAKRHGVWWCI